MPETCALGRSIAKSKKPRLSSKTKAEMKKKSSIRFFQCATSELSWQTPRELPSVESSQATTQAYPKREASLGDPAKRRARKLLR